MYFLPRWSLQVLALLFLIPVTAPNNNDQYAPPFCKLLPLCHSQKTVTFRSIVRENRVIKNPVNCPSVAMEGAYKSYRNKEDEKKTLLDRLVSKPKAIVEKGKLS